MTVKDVIKRAMRQIGAEDFYNEANGVEFNTAMGALNNLLNEWSAHGFVQWKDERVTHTLSSGTASYTIGSGGDIDTTRPAEIRSIFLRRNNTDYPLEQRDRVDYILEADKQTAQAIPDYFYYEPTSDTLGTITFYPKPDTADTVYIDVRNPLTEYTSLTAALALPPEFENVLVFNLAVDLASEYGREAPPTVQRRAATTLRKMKAYHAKGVPGTYINLTRRGRNYDINKDGWR